MARLKALPAIDIIRGFKGTIDFYLWRGLPCARKWPRRAPGRRTEAEIASAALFGQVSTNYRLLAPMALAAFQDAAKDQPRTARDLYISAVYGHLHEASMTDFLTLLTECRDFLDALTAILDALGSVDTDDLQVDVKTSALPAGAATLDEQQTQTAALALLDQLRGPLASIATDHLQVRGQNQLFSYKGSLGAITTTVISGTNGYCWSAQVPADEIWHVTNVSTTDQTSPTTLHEHRAYVAYVGHYFGQVRAAIPANERVHWSGSLWLDPLQQIRTYFAGGVIGDTCEIILTGSIMTLEP